VANVVQFVDSIASSPTVLLDLNSYAGGWMVGSEGIDLSPPPMRRSMSGTMLSDGEALTASAYSNRTLRFPIRLIGAATNDAAATLLQNLVKQLDKPVNLVKVQLDGATKPVFFRTFRAPDYAFQFIRFLARDSQATLELQAEPFALGLIETATGSPFTVPNNPASAGGCDFSATGVIGDLETPAFIDFTSDGSATGGRVVIGQRLRHASSNVTLIGQAEGAGVTLGTDTTIQGTDATASGATNNWIRTTFSTLATYGLRWTSAFAATPTFEHRGEYRLLARVKHNASVVGAIKMGAVIGGTTYNRYPLPNITGQWFVQDLGRISMTGLTPDMVGYSAATLVPGERVQIWAERTSGTGSLDWDWIAFVPADEALTVLRWSAVTGTDLKVLDGPNDMTYPTSSVDPLAGSGVSQLDYVIARDGGLPVLRPGMENRFIWLASETDDLDVLGHSCTVRVRYWPRYLNVVRPSAT
jgi:hypothetical protein